MVLEDDFEFADEDDTKESMQNSDLED